MLPARSRRCRRLARHPKRGTFAKLGLLTALLLRPLPTLAGPALLLSPHAEFMEQQGPVRPVWRDSLLAAPPNTGQAPAAPPPPSDNRAVVYGYHPYWGVDPTTLDFDRLTHVAIFGVLLNSDGTLSYTDRWTEVAPALVPLAHAAGTRVHVTLIAFGDTEQSAVLPSPSRRATAIAALVSLVSDYDGDGVSLDIEGLSSAYKADLVSFTQELKAALPVGQDDVYLATPAIDWSGAFDYDQLCAASNGLFIMGYGYHYTSSNPGPLSPLFGDSPWSDYALDWTVDDYLAYGATPDCLVMGLPTYGRDWPSSAPATVPGTASASGTSVIMSSAVTIAEDEGRLWDSVTHTPYVVRSNSQLWYDDTQSLGDKIGWSVDQGLQGVGFWALGYEGDDPDFWDMVQTETDLGTTDTTDGGGSDGGSDGGVDSGHDSGDPDEFSGGGGGGEHEPPGTRTPLDSGGCAAAGGKRSSGPLTLLTLLLGLGFVPRQRRQR